MMLSAEHLLVEYRHAAEGPTGPLGEICVELGVDGLQKWSNKGDFELGPGNRSLA